MSARDHDWAKAKRLCQLSAEDVRKARALGLNPRKLIANIPSPSQRWKAPVRDWIGELYRKRFGEPPGAAAAVGPPQRARTDFEDRKAIREIAEDEKQQEAIRAVGLRNAGRCADEARRLSPLDPAGEEKARRAAEPPLLAKRPRRGVDGGVDGQTSSDRGC